MVHKILLNKNKSKESVNEVNIIPVEINRDISLLQDEILTDTIDTHEVYNSEKDKCQNHRFIFTLYPICTNVLCNKITEIVYKEGSDECKVLKEGDTPSRLEAIRNTQYSNDFYNYSYHCGVDIFNNHLLRKKEFIYIQASSDNYNTTFNTLYDKYRDENGNQIQTYSLNKEFLWQFTNKEDLPVYQYDTTYSFLESVENNMIVNNGYVGFYNPSSLPIPMGILDYDNNSDYKKCGKFNGNTYSAYRDGRTGTGYIRFQCDNHSLNVGDIITLIFSLSEANVVNKKYIKAVVSVSELGDGSQPVSDIYYKGPYKSTDYFSVKHEDLFKYGVFNQYFSEQDSSGIQTTKGYCNAKVVYFTMGFIDDTYINKCINDKDGGQFIDLTPERDLFYFTPKYNKYRQRSEYNWDYCLTYPFENVYDEIFLSSSINGLPLVQFEGGYGFYKQQYGANGLQTLMFRCACKHNLQKRDSIKLKVINDNGDIVEFNCDIMNVGNNGKDKDYYFTILENDITKNGYNIDDLKNATLVRISKMVYGYECEYYFRKFKEIEILNGNERIKIKNSLNKLAFANTIYGDDISQLVYTDDVNIQNLRDNRGRPLTEIFLTVIKNNKGYKKWYKENIYKESDIEYSHIFGEVTSGLDLPVYVKLNKIEYPTIRGQHNIPVNNITSKYETVTQNIYIDKSTGYIENDIKRGNDGFYGDLVEFNPITLYEFVIEKVKHRFNTYQREFYSKNQNMYNQLQYDDIPEDNNTIYNTNHPGAKVYNHLFANLGPEGYIYEPHHRIKIGEYDDTVKQASDILMKISDEFTLYVDNNNSNEYLVFSSNINYGILPGDLVSYCEKDGKNLKKFRVLNYYSTQNQNVNIFYFSCGNIKNENEQFTLCELESDDDKELFKKANELQKFYIDGEISKDKDGDYIVNNKKLKDSGILINNNFLKYVIDNKKEYQIKCGVNMSTKLFDTSIYSFFQHNLEIPEYAYMLPDGTGRHLWREIKKPSSYNFTSDLYNIPFTNNAFYHHTNVIFTVKRQDPNREYGMFLRQSSNGPIIDNNFEVKSDKFDISSEEYIDNTIGQTCF